MTTEIRNLYMKLEGAMECLHLLEQQNNAAAIEAQRQHCRALREQLNDLCPDGSLDVYEGTIVASIK